MKLLIKIYRNQNQYQINLKKKKIITPTEVKKIDTFYIAEEYHQGYYKLNTAQPYCNAVITPKVLKARQSLQKYY